MIYRPYNIKVTTSQALIVKLLPQNFRILRRPVAKTHAAQHALSGQEPAAAAVEAVCGSNRVTRRDFRRHAAASDMERPNDTGSTERARSDDDCNARADHLSTFPRLAHLTQLIQLSHLTGLTSSSALLPLVPPTPEVFHTTSSGQWLVSRKGSRSRFPRAYTSKNARLHELTIS